MGSHEQSAPSMICINKISISTIHVTALHGSSCATIEVI
jgi:hypothetical protein